MNYMDKKNSFTPLQSKIILEKGTEYPHTGAYNNLQSSGTYLCRRCGLALFRANQQFHSGCGWPAFDDQISGAVAEKPDADGRRTEILCSRCEAHLGHVFRGEYLTNKNLRHCVNSVSMDFVSNSDVMDSEEIIVAGGCFWGIEHHMQKFPGILLAESGYTGGHKTDPTYNEVCSGNTGHYEAVRVIFDKNKIECKAILKLFFEIHNPEQSNGQGPDIGNQYRSAVFVYNNEQKTIAMALLAVLNKNGFNPVTKILPVSVFWPAEDFHQDYYERKGTQPYCHTRVMRFK